MNEETQASCLRDEVLLCYICHSSAEKDPVSMTCKSQHVFCFSCIYDYYSNCQNQSALSCPNCRFGNGSFLVMSRLKNACDLLLQNTQKEEDNNDGYASSSEYYASLPDLKRRFPKRFRYSVESCVVTTQQMMLFIKNYDLLKSLRTRNQDQELTWKDARGNLIPTRTNNNNRTRRLRASTLPRFVRDESSGLSFQFLDFPRLVPHPNSRMVQEYFSHELSSEDTNTSEDEEYLPSNGEEEEEEVEVEEEEEEEHQQEEQTDGGSQQIHQQIQQQIEQGEIQQESVLRATMDLIRTIDIGMGTNRQRTSPRLRERRHRNNQMPNSVNPQVIPYSLRPRHSNQRILGQWNIDPEVVFCYLAMTVPRREEDNTPRFRISWSRASAVSFVTNRLTTLKSAVIFAVKLSRENTNSISDRAIPILYTVGEPPVLVLQQTPDNSNIVEFLLNQFNTQTTTRLAVHTMISEIHEAFLNSTLSDLVSREITTMLML